MAESPGEGIMSHAEKRAKTSSTELDFTGVPITVEFKHTMKPEWATENPGPVVLENETLHTFKIYLHWLYTRSLDRVEKETNRICIQLVNAYVLGERYIGAAYQNDVLEEIIANVERLSSGKRMIPYGRAIKTIFAGTVEGSPARRLLVDLAVWGGKDFNELGSLSAPAENLHPEFIKDGA
ncbi:hypothetical protein BCR34DRAFT_611932 [Clohesyomyces aquaticus]|uniref:BTB domain-containing protein n=1 Tax=Clohesyomyces aquaticus TaxID=1231657 RepID=A0A1Y2A058_9PLEO|nr:hypothetical protein BCR34DRAFT_611932 [Clohesyomyces aquaticus]